ncbi:DUF2835 family protein [Aliidiomarina maris]|uniref:DUF2835 domain-containing protein n=1 Tax=Aliidiomarina maris TaxID=531312 RepID=A0A327X2S4_9GAMM|nr:DUF2835 family protein [Aliidiomarina maris]MBA3987556.1 DUF2835 domain-containing protein [Idiomarina sp.]MCL5050930.1 DUF2835 domain-containing protein [Bacillota bacterium]RAJ98942.1 uncharacterized protein DUF2835 [Aliidiomarina maris]RUO25085.1 DUF2835 domain-containing protein [Aliidiomarina maris]
MRQHKFALIFSPAELERHYYREGLSNIMVTTEQGLRIQLALRHFTPFISDWGIRGYFLLTLDEHNRFISMQKIADI